MKRILESTRYVAFIGVFALMLSSFAAFAWGAIKATQGILNIIYTVGKDEKIAIALLEGVDAFLIATVLFVFSVSMYALFISDLSLPEWMLAHNLHDLKAKLSGVLVLVMAIKFAEHLVKWSDPKDTLLFGLAIAVITATLIAFSHFGGKD